MSEVLAPIVSQFDRPVMGEMVLNELFRLSQGDPLVLRLYVEALTPGPDQPADLTPENLKILKPGLEGYIHRWGATLRRRYGTNPRLIKAIPGLVNLCATALGPLTRQDLLALAPDIFSDEQLLAETLRAAGNFIIEDEVKDSYVFGHLRLGEFFIDRLSPEEQQAWQARFLRYGGETLAALEAGTLHPDDAPAYVVQYYGAHLSQAAAPAGDFYALLSQPWLSAWLRMEDSYSGFLNDVERAWQQAEAERNIPIQILCALCQTSVATLSVNIHHLVLARAVELEVITPAQALAIARQNPKEVHYIWALIELIPYLSESLLKHALTELQAASSYGYWRITALLKLASHLSEAELKEEAMRAAWRTAHAIDHIFLQMDVLNQITPHLPGLNGLRTAVIEEALARAYTMPRNEPHNDSPKIDALMSVAPHLSPKEREKALSKAYELALRLGDDRDRTQELVKLVSLMPESMKIETTRSALRPIARASGYKAYQSWRAEALTELAPHLPESLHSEALGTARIIDDPAVRAEALAGLWPVLSPQLQETVLQEAIRAIEAVDDDYDWVMAVSRLVPFLPEQLKQDKLDKAVKLAQAETRRFPRARQLASVGIHLSEPLKREVLGEALAIVLKFEYEYSQAQILPTFVSHLTRELLTEVLGTRVAADESARVKIVSGLALHLASLGALKGDMLPVALAAVLAMPQRGGLYDSPQAEALITLAPHLPDSLKAEALTAIRAWPQERGDDKIVWLKSLAGLLAHLPAPLQEEVTQEILSTMPDLPKGEPIGKSRMELMINLPQQLPEPFRNEAWQDALAVVQAAPFEAWRSAALIKLMPHLPDGMKETALVMVKEMAEEDSRVRTMVGMAPHLPAHLMQEALAIIEEISWPHNRVEALLSLAPHLPETLKAKTLTVAQTIRGRSRDRTKVLIGLLPYLPEAQKPDVLDEALEVARKLDNLEDQAEALTGLLPHLPETRREEVLGEVLAVIDQMGKSGALFGHDYPRARLITNLAPCLPAGQRQQEALAVVQSINSPQARVEGWIGLVPHLPIELQAEIVASARQIEEEYLRSELLTGLMPHLPDTLRPKVLEAAQAIEDPKKRAQTICDLAPHLPDTLKATALSKALVAAKTIEEEWYRVETLVKLTPHLPETLWSEFLSVSQTFEHLFFWEKLLEGAAPYMPDQAKREALRLTYGMEPRHWAFKPLAVPLAEWARFQPEAAYTAWRETLRRLVRQSRRDVLNALDDLIPFTLALVEEGKEAEVAEEIFQVIKKVEAWWP